MTSVNNRPEILTKLGVGSGLDTTALIEALVNAETEGVKESLDNKESEYKDTDNIFEPPEHYDIRITKWITEDQLSNCLEGINHGTMDIHNYLNELIKRLAKLQ